MVQLSLSTSTNYEGEQNALIEELGTSLTVNFELDEPAPEGGLKVFVDSDIEQIVSRLDLPGFAFNPIAENINPSLVGTSFDNSGFFLTIDEGATTASFTIDIFDNEEPDTTLPETFDGLVEANFSLVAPGEVAEDDLADVGTLGDYTINSDSASSTVIFADVESQLTDTGETPETPSEPETPETDDSGLPLVSLNTGPDFLVEEDGTVSAHVFNVTEGTIPEDGLVVSVNAPELSEFDLDGIEVTDGGEIVEVREDGFDIRLTDFTVLVDLPIADDGEGEGVETASFTLEAGDGYEVNEDFSNGEFTITDTTDEVPDGAFDRLNDTLPLAIPVELSADNPTVTITDAIDFDIGNRYQNDDGTYTYVDVNEDVDFYSFDLAAGDVISFDLDSDSQRGEPPATVPGFEPNYGLGPFGAMRLFDAQGNELESDWQTQGSGELFTSYDGYLEFVAPEDSTYYLGVSGALPGAPDRSVEILEADRFRYDPFVPGSGDDESFPDSDSPNFGEYDSIVNLNPEVILELPQFSGDAGSSIINDNDSDSNADAPTVSLDFMTATFDPDSNDDLISPYIVEELPNGGSSLILNFQTEGEIPEEGILVNVSSDNYLRQYTSLSSFWFAPFTPGGELETLLYDETGRETGFQFRIFEPNTYISLLANNEYWGDVTEPDVDEPEDVSFFLEDGSGYSVDSDNNEITATYYDSLEAAPELSVIPEVGISVSETELIESEQTATTLTFNLSEPPPEEGVIVQVNGSSDSLLPQFDIFGIEIDGGILPYPNLDFSGFYFKITEQEATITLPVFEDPFDEGLQGFSFSLQEAPNYTVDSDASEAEFTIADNPDSVVEVSLSSESETLVESENSTGILTFNLTANPPSEGVTVTVDAPNLSEFDVDALTVTGGEITEITDSGFSLNIADATAIVELPILADSEAEGLETATFTLAETTGTTINPDTNETTITLADNTNQIPVTEEIDSNDTIAEADELNLNLENNFSATVRGILSDTDPEEDFTELNNLSEDVDIYEFDLEVGDNLTVDVDAVGEFNLSLYEGVDLRLDSELRLFDAEGNELASVNNAAAPDEEFGRDPYLEFTPDEAGSYYIGVSQLGNDNYDPNVEGSGSGWIFPEIGVFTGEYDLNVELTSDGGGNGDENTVDPTDPSEPTESIESTFEPVFGSLEVDTIAVAGSNQLIFAGSMNDLVDATTGEGDNRIYAGSGDDTLILGEGDRILAGAGDDAIFTTSGGDNTITGGAGADKFWIASAELPDSANTITDFTNNEDVIGIAGLGIGFDDVSITNLEGNALISANDSDLAVLQGVEADSLTIDDFAFA